MKRELKVSDVPNSDKECVVTRYGQDCQILWIKHFFDIKEDDLNGSA